MKPIEAPLTKKHPDEHIDDVRRQAVGSAVATPVQDEATPAPTISPQLESTPVAGEEARVFDLPGAAVCISYVSLSTANVDSEHRQVSSILETVQKFGLPPITHQFYDEIVAGTPVERPGYIALKAICIANRGATIVTERVDRVVRSAADGYAFSKFMAENRIVLCESKGIVANRHLLKQSGTEAAVRSIHGRNYENDW